MDKAGLGRITQGLVTHASLIENCFFLYVLPVDESVWVVSFESGLWLEMEESGDVSVRKDGGNMVNHYDTHSILLCLCINTYFFLYMPKTNIQKAAQRRT